ncbi:Ligand-gated ion channel [Popillia japonica]|uniref:Ligand-gated ion channel n=1 Tax=Popillia japonica TaxID=7064 RepID=A0AAW1NAM7_POPJA
MWNKPLILVSLILLFQNRCASTKKPAFIIGGIFHINQDELEAAFKSTIDIINSKNHRLPFTIKDAAIRHDGRNGLQLSHKTCNLLARGVHTIIGPDSYTMSRHVGVICSGKDVPQISTRSYSSNEDYNHFTINLHPHPPKLETLFVELLNYLEWTKFMIIYQNNDDLIKMNQLLSYKSNTHDIKLSQLILDDRMSYRLMLNAIKKSGECHFVVVCDLLTLKRFLQQAQQVGLLTENHHYVVYNFDMSNIDVEPYQYGGCEIISVRFFDPSSIEIEDAFNAVDEEMYINYGIETESHTLNLETALVMDAVKLIHTILKERMLPIENQPLYCNDSEAWWHGPSFRNYINVANVKGYTGWIKFDPTGYRTDFEADIIELKSEGLVKIGTWNSSNGLIIERPKKEDPLPEDDSDVKGRKFNVVSVMTRPYGLMKQSATSLYGNERYEGFGIDLIHELSKELGFEYNITSQDDGANGSRDNKTGRWDGMIGKVMYKEADLAIGDLTITSEREQVVDFTLPFMTLGITILYKKAKPVPPSLFMFTSPFSPQVWLLLVVAWIFVSLSLFVMGRLSPSEWQNPYPCIEEPEYLVNQFTFKNSFWFTVGSLMQQGTELAPIGISTRMLAGVWWFFTLIMVSSYTANLAAFLTVTTLNTPFSSIDELAKQEEIKYGAKANGATAFFFKESEKPIYQQVWKYMTNNPDLMVKDNMIGVDRVLNENYAFLMESTSIEYATEKYCTLAKIGDLLDEKGYGIAMRKGSPYRQRFNTALLKLQETGMLTTLRMRWWKEKLIRAPCEEQAPAAAATALDLQNVGGVFLVLGLGTFCGMLMAFLELSMDILRYIKPQNAKYKQQMREEMKFFLEFKKNVKPTRKAGQENQDGGEFPFNINYMENYINENNQNE